MSEIANGAHRLSGEPHHHRQLKRQREQPTLDGVCRAPNPHFRIEIEKIVHGIGISTLRITS